MKKHLLTSLTMSIEVLSAVLGIPFPLWLPFVGFTYFVPIFLVQVVICLPVLVSLYTWGDSLIPSGYWFVHIIFFGVIMCGIMAFGLIYWVIGKIFRRFLERYSPWLKAVT